VYREPVPEAGAPYGWRYAAVAILRPGEHITPLSAPASPIPAADLIP